MGGSEEIEVTDSAASALLRKVGRGEVTDSVSSIHTSIQDDVGLSSTIDVATEPELKKNLSSMYVLLIND